MVSAEASMCGVGAGVLPVCSSGLGMALAARDLIPRPDAWHMNECLIEGTEESGAEREALLSLETRALRGGRAAALRGRCVIRSMNE